MRKNINLMISNVLKELLKRKHEVKVYAYFIDKNSIRMFCDLNLQVLYSKELTEDSTEIARIILYLLSV